jgi:WD40 repeat protein
MHFSPNGISPIDSAIPRLRTRDLLRRIRDQTKTDFPQSLTVVSIVVCLMIVSGCGAATPSTSGMTNARAADSEGSQVAKSTSELVGSNKDTKVELAQSSKSGQKSDSAVYGSARSATAKSAMPPLTPTPEQIAKWAIPDVHPLHLLACYDGFVDWMVQSLAISPDGKQFVLGGVKLTLWNTDQSKPLMDLLVHDKSDPDKRLIRSVAISPDGKSLAAGDKNGLLRIWNLIDQHEAVSAQAHDGYISQLAFAPNSEQLATTSYSGEVRLWNVADGKKINTIKVSEREIARLEFLSDTQLATAGTEASLWNLATGTKETVLTKGWLIGPALCLSNDRQWLAFSDSDSKTRIWDVRKSSLTEPSLQGVTGNLMDFSPDGKRIAIYSGDYNIRICDVTSGQTMQVINADGDRTSALKWLPNNNALLIASERGRVRIWGTTESAKTIGIEPLETSTLAPVDTNQHKSLSSGHWQRVFDPRSFPRLPAAVSQWSDTGVAAYTTMSSQKDAELFYRYVLGKQGWTENTTGDPAIPGISFRKDGCELSLFFTPLEAPAAPAGTLQVSIQFAGNYDVRWLPRISEIKSPSSWNSFSSVSYRTKAELTDVEVAIIKQFHDAGWTGYSRLNASRNEEANSRSFSMLQGGSVLTVYISHPADSTDELSVQTSVTVSSKTLPIPPDAGWIEFDSSTNMMLVANTKMDLAEATRFFETEMASEGWLARVAGRQLEEKYSYLPFIRGQQSVLLGLTAREDGGTRIIVGDAYRSSWQLKTPAKPDTTSEKKGIEAADLALPKGATSTKFDVDQKKIEFEIPDISPPKLAEEFVAQFKTLEWKREDAGVMSDDYCFLTFSKDKAEIQFRLRGNAKKTTAMISGDGLLWTKAPPSPPVRVSYETWLLRSGKETTLDRLDEFAKEMHAIPSGRSK